MTDPRAWPQDFVAAESTAVPAGWVRWHETDVAMDVACVCGERGPVVGLNACFVRCPRCGRTYSVGTRVALSELTAAECVAIDPIPLDVEPT